MPNEYLTLLSEKGNEISVFRTAALHERDKNPLVTRMAQATAHKIKRYNQLVTDFVVFSQNPSDMQLQKKLIADINHYSPLHTLSI